MIITLKNIKKLQEKYGVINKRLVIGDNTIPKYELLNELNIQLSNGNWIKIPKGYIWDLSSVPRIFWWLFAPDGDFAIAYLIHDFIYEFKLYPRKFCDDEMLIWSKETSGTKNISFRNFDNLVRYYTVRLFGWAVYNK